MENIQVITVGPLKEAYRKSEVDEYAKRLGMYGKLIRTEIPAHKLPQEPSASEINTALTQEGEAILKAIPKGAHVIALCVEGKKFDSPSFANYVSRAKDNGAGTLTFIIGSSYGLAESVKKRADVRLSMSEMTFPHQLARVMLFEQIYRAFMISNSSRYHK